MLENISFTILKFLTCFTSHLLVICRNHGMKIKTVNRNWLILSKMPSLNTNTGLLSSGRSAGLKLGAGHLGSMVNV